jgi:hypothetical protein
MKIKLILTENTILKKNGTIQSIKSIILEIKIFIYTNLSIYLVL